MANLNIVKLLVLLNLGTLLISLACPTCPKPTPPRKMSPPPPCPPPPKAVKPPPTPVPKTPASPPKAPASPPTPVPKTPASPPKTPASPPKAPETCPIDTLKLGACVDLLGGLVNIVIGSSTKDSCCPVLEGLADLDAAVCLCTTIKAKLLNINIVLPIALELLVDCGKNAPEGFKCPA